MRKPNLLIRVSTWLFLVMLALPAIARSQAAAPAVYSKAELAQMLAPVALYPDSLLIQVLMAGTYPVEVQQAAAWVAQNSTLQGDQLDAALIEAPWDVSVKSVAHVPRVLQMMNEQIEWTASLGNAFLSQQPEVMDTVQELRLKAQSAGYLKTSNQQKVIVEQKIIRIEPPAPEVVYVPVYNPTVVYGPWLYPAYPPSPVVYSTPAEVPVVAGVIGFTAGFMVGAAVNSWVAPNWGQREVNININKTVNYNNINIRGRHDKFNRWEHNPIHRQGLPYNRQDTASRFNGKFDPHPPKLTPVQGPGTKSGFTGTKSGFTGTTGTKSGFTGTKSGFTGTTGTKSGFTGTTGTKSGFTGTKSGFTGTKSGFTGTKSGFTGTKSGFTGTTGTKSGFTGTKSGFTGTKSGFTGTKSGFTGTKTRSSGTTGGPKPRSTGMTTGSRSTTNRIAGTSSTRTSTSSGRAATSGVSKPITQRPASHPVSPRPEPKGRAGKDHK
ncbi:MAG: DUF3300 domain-containing protein [Deltaproteobacteria bacterium]|nr:DUF3300 domain-containing protein [Deltaproteobacteria bacterium]